MSWTVLTDKTTGTLITAAHWNLMLGVTGNLAESAPAKVTTAGDMLVATGANALARLAAVATGQVLKSAGVGVAPAYGQVTPADVAAGTYGISVSGNAATATGAPPTGPAGGALAGTYPNPTLAVAAPIANSSAESVLGSDVNMSASATWTDIGPSLSLAAGEWLVMAHVTFLSTSPVGNADARIYDSTGAVELASGSEYVESSRYRTIAMVARVVLAGTSTVKLQYFVVTGSASWNVDSGGGAGSKATKLVAVRVA